MKKIFLLVLTAFIFIFTVGVKNSEAKVIVKENGSVIVGADEVVDDDLFVAADTVEILGNVTGDVYVGTGTLRVDGNIGGNLHAGSGTTTISGIVSGSIYLGSGSVYISSATIGNSLLIGAGNATIDKNSSIGGSLLVGSGTLSVYSPVMRNVFVGAGTVDLDSEVGGEVRIGAGSISLGPNTKIAKDFYYAVDENEGSVNISDSSTISGVTKKVEQTYVSEKDLENAKQGFSSVMKTISSVSKIISLIGAFIVGYLTLKIFGGFFENSAEVLQKTFWKSLEIGFVIIVLSIPVLVLLVITGVGAPLAWVLFLLLMLAMYFAKIVAAVCFGNWLGGKFGWEKKSKYLLFAVGLVGIYILKFIPVVEFITSLVVLFAGLGALTLQFKTLAKSK